jgi:hypothetical protein
MRKLVLLSLLVVGILQTACASSQPQIEMELEKFDFGDVVNGVIASREVTVRNTGGADLVISTVTTTCGCTTASLDQMVIPAGDESVLQINFDSGAHGPYLEGEVLRRVILISNDPEQPEATVDFGANILLPE